MKIGKIDLRIYENGRDITENKEHDVLPFPIVPGSYRQHIFSSDYDLNPDSATLAFNHVIDLFREVRPQVILNHFEIELVDESGTIPDYYLNCILGEPYLTSDNFGELLIPLGRTNASESLESAPALDKAMAGTLLDHGNEDAKDNEPHYAYFLFATSVYDAFTDSPEQWSNALKQAEDQGRIIVWSDEDTEDEDEHAIEKLDPFAWYSDELVRLIDSGTFVPSNPLNQ